MIANLGRRPADRLGGALDNTFLAARSFSRLRIEWMKNLQFGLQRLISDRSPQAEVMKDHSRTHQT